MRVWERIDDQNTYKNKNKNAVFEWCYTSAVIAMFLWHFSIFYSFHFFLRALVTYVYAYYSKLVVFFYFSLYHLSMICNILILLFPFYFRLHFFLCATALAHANSRLLYILYSQWWPSFIWPKLRMSM